MTDPIETPIVEEPPAYTPPPDKPLDQYTVDDWWTLGHALHLDHETYFNIAVDRMLDMSVRGLKSVREAIEEQVAITEAEYQRRMSALAALRSAIDTARA